MNVPELDEWLRTLHTQQYLSLMLRSQLPPQFETKSANYTSLDRQPLEQDNIYLYAQHLLRMAGREEIPETVRSLNFVINSMKIGTFRVQLFTQRECLSIFVSTRDLQTPTLADLGCDEEEIDSFLQAGTCTLICGTHTQARTFAAAEYAGRISSLHIVFICSKRTYELPHNVTVKEVGVDCDSYEEALLESQNCGVNVIITDNLPTPEAANVFLQLWELGVCCVAALPSPDYLNTRLMSQLFLSRLPRPARLRGALLFDQRNFFVWTEQVVKVETAAINWMQWI